MLVKSSGAQEIVPTRPLAGSARHRTGWTRWLLSCHTPILGSQPNLLGCKCDPARKVTCASPEQSLRCIRGWRRWRGRRLMTPGPDSQRASLLSGPPPPEGSGVRLRFPHPAHPQRPEVQTWIPLSSSRGLRPRSCAPAGKSRPTCRVWVRPSSERVSPDF